MKNSTPLKIKFIMLLALFVLPLTMVNLQAQCNAGESFSSYCYDNDETNVVAFEVCPDAGEFVIATILQGTFEASFDDLTVYSGASGSGTGGTIVFGPADGDLAGTIITGNAANDCLIFVINSDGSVSCVSGAETELQVCGLSTPVICPAGEVTNAYCYDNNETNLVIFEFCPSAGETAESEIEQGSFEASFDDLTVYSGASGSGTGGTIVFGPADGDLTGSVITGNATDDCLIFVTNSDGSVSCQGGSETELVVCSRDAVTSAPPNDLCANAIDVVSPSNTAGTTVNATTTGAPPTCVTTVTTGGVWYTYTSFGPETVTVDLCGAPYDSKIGIYTGSCGSFTCVTGEDDDFDNCGGDDPSVDFVSTANLAPVTYYIYVHGFGGEQGTFVLNLSGVPLPVELTSFQGEVMENYNKLMWETASEENTAMHVIERSADGRDNWEVIGEVAAAGNTYEAQQYYLDDRNPVAQAYYRLKSVDFDGYTDYSDIILLERKVENFEVLSIAPNPVRTTVSIDFQTPEQGQYSIRMTNMVGQVVYIEQLNLDAGIHSKNLHVSALANGVYFITIENSLESLVHKIVKQ